MRIATWNVNSIRAREPALLAWLGRAEPDVVCLQETKVVDDDFPSEELLRMGYAAAFAGQKTYNGVAILSRLPLRDVTVGFPDDAPGAEKRLIAATIGGVRVLSAYVPNGKDVTHADFKKKLAWLGRLRRLLDADASAGRLGGADAASARVALCGDFNIAPEARDVWDPVRMAGQLHFHPAEHAALGELLGFGLVDAFRLHHAEAGAYSWWDYRGGGFERQQGLRIDFVFLSRALAARCTRADIDVEPRRGDKPSDHTPVVVELAG